MKIIILCCLLTTAKGAFAQHENHQPKADTTKTEAKPKSPKMTAMAMVGNNHVHIDYGSPNVRGRSIWNGLVAYNQVWSSGAHNATWIEFGEDVTIEGKQIPKGKYGFFTIPNKKQWVLILSKTWDMHLADDYKPENDVLRINVKPKKNKDLVEALMYEVIATNEKKGTIKLSWEYVNVAFDFENKQ
ncbi:MAG: DUF2911 domain-containing protein [Runella slithyformis]|nr:MAG: DUF2911 domain-containing protein [Runella slithyformis]TAF29183.1 MAG: DUF2911 domain-containing protein [Runella slithyformis]TAF48091.1 MAG: DUF2911 domain-containing protein [Runella slithyformis]TAF82882.1 MAG: DUF2911 domain-containing protein [Runella slithyformis]